MAEVLSKKYQDAEYVFRQGEPGDCMYIVVAGEVEVVRRRENHDFVLAMLGPGEFFGEMALIEGGKRNAGVRAVNEAEVITLDRGNFLKQVQEDPSLAYQILGRMADRTRDLSHRLKNIGALLPNETDAFRAYGNVYPLSIEREPFMQKVRENPALALQMLQEMSGHISEMDDRLVNITVFSPADIR
jgi:CRP-like cAMP-binding protein